MEQCTDLEQRLLGRFAKLLHFLFDALFSFTFVKCSILLKLPLGDEVVVFFFVICDCDRHVCNRLRVLGESNHIRVVVQGLIDVESAASVALHHDVVQLLQDLFSSVDHVENDEELFANTEH